MSLYNLITLSLYNLIAAKMIGELEITYMSFCISYTVIMELDTKIKSKRKIEVEEVYLCLLKFLSSGKFGKVKSG